MSFCVKTFVQLGWPLLSIALLLSPIIYSPFTQASWSDCGLGYFSKRERTERAFLIRVFESKSDSEQGKHLREMEATIRRWSKIVEDIKVSDRPGLTLKSLFSPRVKESPDFIMLAATFGLRDWILSTIRALNIREFRGEEWEVPSYLDRSQFWRVSLEENQVYWVNLVANEIPHSFKSSSDPYVYYSYQVMQYLHEAAVYLRYDSFSFEMAVDRAAVGGNLLQSQLFHSRQDRGVEHSIGSALLEKAKWLYDEAIAETSFETWENAR